MAAACGWLVPILKGEEAETGSQSQEPGRVGGKCHPKTQMLEHVARSWRRGLGAPGTGAELSEATLWAALRE